MKRRSAGPIFLLAALLLLVALVAPVLAVIAAMPPTQAFAIFAKVGGDALRVSLIASAGATLIATLLGVPTGYYLAQMAPESARRRALLAGPTAGISAGRLGFDAHLCARHELAGRLLAGNARTDGAGFAAGRRGRRVLCLRVVRRHCGDRRI